MELFDVKNQVYVQDKCHEIILDAVANAVSRAHEWKINHPEIDSSEPDKAIAETVYGLLYADEELNYLICSAPELPDEDFVENETAAAD